jgi:hypothetical protein
MRNIFPSIHDDLKMIRVELMVTRWVVLVIFAIVILILVK